MSNRKTIAEKIQAQQAKKEQMEAEIKRLLQQQKAEERKARNHRICKRGGLIESLLPDVITLSDERFKAFLNKTVANDFGRRALAILRAEQDKEDGAADENETQKTPDTMPKGA